MKRWIIVLITAGILLVGSTQAMAGGSDSTGYTTVTHYTSRSVKLTKIEWISSVSTGLVSGATFQIDGEIGRVVTDPGSAAPTDNYDIYFYDVSGIDAAQGQLNNRDTSTTEERNKGDTSFDAPFMISGDITLSITNAGNSKTGTIYIWWR